MAKGKGFELVAQPLPPRRRSSASFYRQIIEEFQKSGEKTVLIAGTGRRPVTLVQGLRKALEKEEAIGIVVSQRAGEVYLSRQDEETAD